ncbi:MAG: hypothetical protein Q9163_005185 [Psora crenata]
MSPRNTPSSAPRMRTRRSGGSASSSLTTPPNSDPALAPHAPTPSGPIDPVNGTPPTPTTRRARPTSSPPRPARNLTFQQQAAVARNPALGPKYRRMAALKAHFAGVTKALKPALRELGTRTERKLRQKNAADEPVVRMLERQLERNLAAQKARLGREVELIKEMKTKEHRGVVAARDAAYRRKIEGIREEMLAHAKLDFMVAVHAGETSSAAAAAAAKGQNLGQGSNERKDRKPREDGRSAAYYIETQARENEDFYRTTDKMWEDWMARLNGVEGGEEMRGILPRPYGQIQQQETAEALAQKERRDGRQAEMARAREQARKRAAEQPKPYWASRENYVKGMRQTKWSKRGQGSVPMGAVEEGIRKERLERIKHDRSNKPPPPPPARAAGGRSGKAGGGKGRKRR